MGRRYACRGWRKSTGCYLPLPLLMGCACRWACPDWPVSKCLPMSAERWRSLSHVAPGSTQTALSSLLSHIAFIFPVLLPPSDSSLGKLCYPVMSMAMKMWVDWWGAGAGWWWWWGVCIKAACPAVDQGRNPASGWLSQEYHGQRQWIPVKGWMIIFGWGSCTRCGFYFWLCARKVFINLLQGRKRKDVWGGCSRIGS